ncbi:hypothetical protein LTR94_025170 [Friedmanniomyces endolithicus]|nr:hypothetical protein LTR94_025170 [Friedmanniomyces endolithicus]
MTSPSITEDQIMTGLRAFILDVLPKDQGIEVVQGQDNGVPMPSAGDFVVMTPARRQQLSQTARAYDPDAGEKELDTYGPNASDYVQIITTLFRDEYGFNFFKARGLAPLYCDDGAQMPLVSGEQTYIQRWTMHGLLQANLAVTVNQEFADTLITTLREYH